MDSRGCDDDLIFPQCTENESIAIGQLLNTCPVDMHQIALDEIEGARQAGVIKTNLVPFARGIMTAIARGTFTVGHGSKVAAQRMLHRSRLTQLTSADLTMDLVSMNKGKAFLERSVRKC